MTGDKALSQMVAEAYGQIAGEPEGASGPKEDSVSRAYDSVTATPEAAKPAQADPVAAAFNALAGSAAPVKPQDATASAYAGVPSDSALKRFDQLEAARGNTAGAFAGIAPRTVLSLMNGQALPPRGMFSALQASALEPGQFSLLQNVRIDDRTIRARQPTTNRTATGLPGTSQSFRGLWSGRLNGTVYVVAAAYDGAKVGVYFSTNGTAFTAASETSGAFGDTRMTDTGVPFSFAVVNNIGDGLDYLTVQNGADAPRVFGPTAFHGSYLRVIKQFSPPAWALSTLVQTYVNTPYLSNLSGVSSPSGAGHLSANLNGTAPGQSASLTIGTSTAAGDQLIFDFGAGGLNVQPGYRQLMFVSDQASMNAWNFWKVEVSEDDATWVTLSDPTSSTYYAPARVSFADASFTSSATSGGLNGEEVAAFDLTVATPASLSALRYLRLTWEGVAPASAFTTTIHGIFGSGAQLAYQQNYMLSYSGLAGLSESPGVVTGGFAAKTGSLITGCSQRTFFPFLALLYYDHAIPTQVQLAGDLASGCDTVNVYRQDYGATDFFFFESFEFGTYSGSNWVYPGSGTTTAPTFSPSVTIDYALYDATALNVAWYAPDAYAEVMPLAICMASANGRTFVGGAGFYAVSEYGQAFRFRPALQFLNGAPVERSATYVTLSGQTVSAFATPSGSALNSQTVFFWTQTKTYACGGFDGYSLSRPAVVFEIGCSAPCSVAQYKDAIFWLDDNRQIRRFTYGRSFLYGYSNANAYDLAPAISRMVVDDQTSAIPQAQLKWVRGLATYDRYYLFYSPSGGTSQTLALVLEETLQAFVRDSLSVGAQGACAADLSAGRTLLLAGADGAVYTHEDVTSGANVSVQVTTREVSAQMWNPQFFGRVGLVMDVQAGQTCSVTVAVKPNQVDSSTLDLSTSATGQVWRWASRATSTQPGLHGVSGQVNLQMSMGAGTHLYGLAIETTTSLPGPDQL
jgi:hypothetical protein